MTTGALRDSLRQVPLLAQGLRIARLALAALLLLALRLARPLVNLRIGLLFDERIGHLAANTEYWLRTVYAQRGPRDRFLLVSSARPANAQLLRMIGRVVPVIRSGALFAAVGAARARWPRLAVWLDLGSLGPVDYALWSNSRPQLAFTVDEKQRGRALLRAMGVPDGASFVCFAMRDKAYLAVNRPDRNWTYHDYRDVDIEHCRPMAEWLAAQGIWVIRMGATVAKPFASTNPRIIDYASGHRSDFGDIFLLGHCKFFVGDTAGVFWPAGILGVPVALTNLVPITLLYPIAGSMVMPKRYRRSGARGFMTYREVVTSGADGYLGTAEYERAGIELVENTPEEILGMAQEMNARIDGTWVATPEDEELHARFWSIFPPGHPSHGCPVRVPVEFLRRNRELVDQPPSSGSHTMSATITSPESAH